MLARSTFASRSSGRYETWSVNIMRSISGSESCLSKVALGEELDEAPTTKLSGFCHAESSERYIPEVESARRTSPILCILSPVRSDRHLDGNTGLSASRI